jgi:serine phosphatase RsbU (regulator of sigma subunit)/pSer/pThr/pTyr-binding forkhead associated (FHA) protein
MAFLRKFDGSRTIPLRPRLTLIGREPNCDISVPQSQISGRHAIIVNLGGKHYIEDLSSLNGTCVNGKRVEQRTPLAPGDRIEFPGLTVSFHEIAPEGAAAQPPVVISPSQSADALVQQSVVSSLNVNERVRPAVAPEAKLRAVMEIADTLGNTLVLDKVLPRILESLFAIFPKATRGFIVLRDPITGQLIPKAVHPHSEQGGGRPALSLTVVEHALATGRAILTVDAGRDQRFNASESIRMLKLQSIMCAPMVTASGKVLGVIQIDTKDSTGIFNQEDLDVLLCASTQAARAIELARLHEELRDLEAANRIQHSFLPDGHPQVGSLQFFDHYSPAQQIGGDYFDYIPLPGNRIAVTLGDVAGKGIAAALLMARLSAAARFCLATTPGVAEAVCKLNHDLARTFGDDRFTTFLVGVIDLAQYTVTLVNAGHLPPLRCRAGGGAAEPIGADLAGLPLAGINYTYEAMTLTLDPGDDLIFYTDGVTEARNPAGDFYGVDRLHAIIDRTAGGVEQVGGAILADVRKFAAGRSQSDDLTLVCFGRGR